jgi:hypothetical protein
MVIKGIFVKATNEILYSRHRHDYRSSSDGKVSVDGGMDYFRVIGNPEDYIILDLDGDVILQQQMAYDYAYGNKSASIYPEGYFGKYIIRDVSNLVFYKKLILNYNEVRDYFESICKG